MSQRNKGRMVGARRPPLSQSVPAKELGNALYQYWTPHVREMLQGRNNLSRDDLEYLAEKVAALKDERLKECIATLIGWGDDERAELETFCAMSLQLLRECPPSALKSAIQTVELRSLQGANLRPLLPPEGEVVEEAIVQDGHP